MLSLKDMRLYLCYSFNIYLNKIFFLKHSFTHASSETAGSGVYPGITVCEVDQMPVRDRELCTHTQEPFNLF